MGTVVVPTAVLVLLWLACASVMITMTMSGRGFLAHHRGLTGISVATVGTVVIIAVIMLATAFTRRLSREVSGLAATAQTLTSQLAAQVATRTRGGAPAPPDVAQQLPPRAAAEIAMAGTAIADLQATAAEAAASEANLRDGLREVFVSMARRNQSLLQRQLRLIDALEQKASDPAALADLFSLDHLTTRMRRHAESLAILSGAAPGRAWREPVPVIDVIRGAMAEVEDYKRVSVMTRSEDSITGAAVADMIHLLAELIENATLFSPSGTRVEVRAGRVANVFAVEIDDRGLGVEAEQLTEINHQLASPPDFDLANADRLGLFVGGKLAARHGVRVSLRTSPYGGTTAIVLMPNSIVAPPPGTLDGLPADSMEAELAAATRPAGLDLRSGESRAPASRRPVPPADTGLAPTVGRMSGEFPGRLADSPSVPPGQAPALPSRRSAARAASRAASQEGPAPSPPTAPVSADPGRSGPGSAPGTGPLAGRPRLDLPGAGTPGPGTPLPAPPAPAPAAAAHAVAPPAPTRPGVDVFRRPIGDGPTDDEPLAGDDGTYHGLPRRTRQASLSPHLRESTLASGRGSDAGTGLPPEDIPAPEHARNLAASLQSGWQRGRASDPAGRPGPAGVAEPGSPGTTDTPPATTMRAARRQDSEESSNEDG
ncbi:MAG TPA: ATP-binding protein [Streptosporangiaceae bacterium]|nr:ATP-binding protein [Streptosporangiaceae bacterium]